MEPFVVVAEFGSRGRPGFDARGPAACRHCAATLEAEPGAAPDAPS